MLVHDVGVTSQVSLPTFSARLRITCISRKEENVKRDDEESVLFMFSNLVVPIGSLIP